MKRSDDFGGTLSHRGHRERCRGGSLRNSAQAAMLCLVALCLSAFLSGTSVASVADSAPPRPELDYVLGPEDQVTIAVLGASEYPEFSQPVLVTVRPDGKISLGRVGELTAAGETARQVRAESAPGPGRVFRKPPA